MIEITIDDDIEIMGLICLDEWCVIFDKNHKAMCVDYND